MNLFRFLFGEKPAPLLDRAPETAQWRAVRPREDAAPVRAMLAESDCDVPTRAGVLHARGGLDMIVDYEGGDRGVVRRDIFEQLYEPGEGGSYAKRTDVSLRYFTLERPVRVKTLEGVQYAEAGDWILEGPAGELWPVPAAKALEKYEPA